ncbi:MAG: ATP-binding protein [Erysipelotrichaceae bacterium]|nr:ATP-binding protein [Erysipelotrichaceae bacterium]
MLTNSTIDKLIEMRFTAMADAFRIQISDPKMQDVSFEDRFSMLVDIEYSKRKDNRLKRLIKKADFEQPDATIAGIDYHSGRKLNRDLIDRLATCDYITEYRNIFITGAAGSGKTYMACAFGLAACMKYYKVKFVRLPDLLMELLPLVGTDQFAAKIKQYTNPTLLIVDEWLLTPLSDDEAKVVFEVIHKRRKKSSTIFCSQFLEEGWYERIGSTDNPLADSIMDRIKYDAYKIRIQAIDPDHDRSMRELYGLDPAEAE